ncbi:MAG: DUF4936 family protein [Burkholderiales bacterium]|nr:DUF4936 family protein [Burkholderiales bacterium]
MDCYIYFKATPLHEAQIVQQEQQWMQLVQTRLGVTGCLQRRPETRDDFHTWMEIYRNVPLHFAEQLNVLLENSKATALHQCQRHAEYFMDIDLCV